MTGYRLYRSADSGATFTEMDASQVKGNPNKHSHTVASSNFAAGDIGKTYLFKVVAENPVGSLDSATVSALLASPPATPSTAPASDASRTSAS